MQGTHCVSGSGLGVVVATGDKTVFGRIAKLTNEPKTGMSTLEREILYFVILIVLIMLSMIILVIIIWYAPVHHSRDAPRHLPSSQGLVSAKTTSRLDQGPHTDC